MTEVEAQNLLAETPHLPAPPSGPHPGDRQPEVAVDPIFVDRWSPRSFSPDPIEPSLLRSLFEAARWAPSSYNEQPWLFLVATAPEDRARFAEGLLPANRIWAEKAPVLVYLLARTHVVRQGAKVANPNAGFDAGAAWMSLALQAHLHGLSVHAMGGIDRETVAERLGVPTEDYQVLIAIAVGYRGEASSLPEPLSRREHPTPRRPLNEVVSEGGFPLLPATEGVPLPS